MEDIPYRLPLVIGATGHRDLRDEDIPALEHEVAEAIKRLKRDYLHDDKETPLIVLSSLAEGADRLIARVAMAEGAKLIAPLPMEPDEYRRDFEPGLKPGAAAEFDRMKSEALSAPVVRYVDGNTRENVREESRRALQYREVGLFIVRHCHVLIALWNGDENDPAVGGTAEVVSFKRRGIPLYVTRSARASLDASEIGPVIHVVTPRAKSNASVTDVRTAAWGVDIIRQYRGGRATRAWRVISRSVASFFGARFRGSNGFASGRENTQLEAWEAFASKIALTRRFNRDTAYLFAAPDGNQRLNASLSYLFDDPESKISKEAAVERSLMLVPHWCALYQIADTLAQRWQFRFMTDWRTLFLLGFCSIVSFEVLTHLLFDLNVYWLLAVYSISLACVFLLFFYARHNHHQENFLDYRALAEAARVSVFWKLLGIGLPRVFGSEAATRSIIDLSWQGSVADAYPIRQPSELDWVKTCLRAVELLDTAMSPVDTDHRPEVDGHAWARTFWVGAQLAFFRRRGPQHEYYAELLESRSVIFLIFSIALAAILAMFDYGMIGSTVQWSHHDWPHRIIILLIGLFPALAAVMTGYSEKLALKAQARQYDRMRVLFERAYELLPQAIELENLQKMQALYAELGAEAMGENAEWVAIYRQRPIRPP